MSDIDDIPCGNCDIGVYSDKAFYNRTAREFSVLSKAEREANMPRCKKMDRECIGAKHFSSAISQIDGDGDSKCNKLHEHLPTGD